MGRNEVLADHSASSSVTKSFDPIWGVFSTTYQEKVVDDVAYGTTVAATGSPTRSSLTAASRGTSRTGRRAFCPCGFLGRLVFSVDAGPVGSHLRFLSDPAEHAGGVRRLCSVEVLLCSCQIQVAYRRGCRQGFFGGTNVSCISSGSRIVKSLEPALPR